MTPLPTFSLSPLLRGGERWLGEGVEGAPEIVQHHRVRPRRAPYCFLRLYYQGGGNGSLKPRTRREAIRWRGSPFLPPLPSLNAPVALFHPAFARRWNRRQPHVPYGATQVLKSAQFLYHFWVITFLVFAHLPPPFRFCASWLLPGCWRSTLLYCSVYCRNDSATATVLQLGADSHISNLAIFVWLHSCHLRISP